MTRGLDSPTQTAIAGDNVPPAIYFVKLEFDSGDVLLHSGLGSISWGGDTYTGAGPLGSISPVNENSEMARSTLELKLSGIDGSITALVFNEHYQGRRATVYLGFLNTTTGQLTSTPFIIFKGRMDVPQITQGKTLEIALTVENRLADWDKPNVGRYNGEDQKALYPGDKGLDFIEQAAEKTIVWGQKSA